MLSRQQLILPNAAPARSATGSVYTSTRVVTKPLSSPSRPIRHGGGGLLVHLTAQQAILSLKYVLLGLN